MIACRFSVTTPPLVDASEPPPLMILKSVVWAARLDWRQSACTCDEARTRGATRPASCSRPEAIGPASGSSWVGSASLSFA